jgi:hypothetical protein
VAADGVQVFAGGHIPHPRRAVGAAGGEQPPVQAELHARDAANYYAARRLAKLLAGRGDVEELRARASAGDWDAASELGDLLDGP